MRKLRVKILVAACALVISAVFSFSPPAFFAGALPDAGDLHETAQPKPRSGPDSPDDLTYMLPIIMYHSVNKKNSGMYNILPSQLEKDLIYIKENNFTPIHVCDLTDFKEKGRPLPPKPVMITFDDAALGLYLYGWPLLKKHGIKFIIAPVGCYTDANYDKEGKIISEMRSHMNWEQLKECCDSGLAEIQNHSYNLHRQDRGRKGMRKKRNESFESYKRIVAADINKMRDLIREKTGAESAAVAYPYGAYTYSLETILREEGYKAAFTCYEKINYINKSSNLFYLCRFNRPGKMSAAAFFEKRMKIQKTV